MNQNPSGKMILAIKNVDYQAYRPKKIAMALFDAGYRKVEQ